MYLLLILLLPNYFLYVSCSQCNTFKTCSECIGYASETCVWCAQDEEMGIRCQPRTQANKKWCINHIQDPSSAITDSHSHEFSSEIQFLPQKLKLKLRPGLPVDFTMIYRPALDFPLDLYFVMDFSYTMKGHSDQLRDQATTIYEALRKMTQNVLLGVGSFIEKPGLPYSNYKYATSYTFKNRLSLTKDMVKFKRLISSLNDFGGNLDNPEAGLDALMQTMTCEKEIGWRTRSRRIIVFITDDTYHTAGDGKMIGAYKPNEMRCHLRNNEYMRNESLIYDYPSVSQINDVATKGNFEIIFAVLEKVKEQYRALANQILNAKYVKFDLHSNIVDIIKQAYKDSVKYIHLDYVVPNYVDLKIEQNCDSKPKLNCESVPTSPEVKIPASIKVTSCSSEGSIHKNFWIKPIGINDSLTIHLEIDCTCPCEKLNKTLEDIIKPGDCSESGFKQCGICKCNQDRGGDKCQFDCTDENAKILSNNCKKNPNDKYLCSGHGSCRCGKCTTCDEGYSGTYCEYNIDQCPQPGGKRCSGRGECVYGGCKCISGWNGYACNCPTDNSTCISPFSSKVCSGRGYCDCGECKCNQVPNKNENYTGIFCGECEECSKERCKELKSYVSCNLSNEKIDCDKKFNQTEDIDVNKTESIDSPDWSLATKCEEPIDDIKLIIFKYQFEKGKLRLLIKKKLDEVPKPNLWIAAGISIGTVLLIGIITAIIWKILIDLYDKREYTKFCKEAKSDGYDVTDNPLYRGPQPDFVNPTYNS